MQNVRPVDERLQALHDLAQTNSFETILGNELVGIAFLPTASEAQFFAELLRVPNDPYRVTTDRNVVLMYRPAADSTFQASEGCLRS